MESLQNIFANAIVLGVIAFALSYGYMYWEEKNKSRKRKSKKAKKVSVLIPGLVGAIVWLVSSFYFDNKQKAGEPVPVVTEGYPFVPNNLQHGGEKFKPVTLSKSKVGRIELPDDDVFLDII